MTPFQTLPQSISSIALANSPQSGTAVESEQKGFVSSVTSLVNGNAGRSWGIADSIQPEDKEQLNREHDNYQLSGLDIIILNDKTKFANIRGGKSYRKLGQDKSKKILSQNSGTPYCLKIQKNERTPNAASMNVFGKFETIRKAQAVARTSVEIILKIRGPNYGSFKIYIQQVIASKYYGDSKLTPGCSKVLTMPKEAIVASMNPDKWSGLDKDY